MIDVFIGYDIRDDKAFRVCETSLKKHATLSIRVHPLKEHELRRQGYGRPYFVAANGQMLDAMDAKPFSTQFSFSRFLVPHLMGYADTVAVFCDADMLWRADIADLIDMCQGDKAVWCVQHKHDPKEQIKMDGMEQTKYKRKNWSSLFVCNPSRNTFLTPERVSELPGSYLHGFCWLKDEEFGSLPESWNWLAGASPSEIEPRVVHYTLGTPDFPGYENAPYAKEWRKTWQSRVPSELERTMWSVERETVCTVSGVAPGWNG